MTQDEEKEKKPTQHRKLKKLAKRIPPNPYPKG
jgi:hypothetical protein